MLGAAPAAAGRALVVRGPRVPPAAQPGRARGKENPPKGPGLPWALLFSVAAGKLPCSGCVTRGHENPPAHCLSPSALNRKTIAQSHASYLVNQRLSGLCSEINVSQPNEIAPHQRWKPLSVCECTRGSWHQFQSRKPRLTAEEPPYTNTPAREGLWCSPGHAAAQDTLMKHQKGGHKLLRSTQH